MYLSEEFTRGIRFTFQCQRHAITMALATTASTTNSLQPTDSVVSREVLWKISASTDSELESDFYPRVLITNKVILELNEHRTSGCFTWEDFSKWLFALSKTRPAVLPNKKSVRTVVLKIVTYKQKLSKNKKKKELDAFLEAEFKIPVSNAELREENETHETQAQLIKSMSKVVEQRSHEIECLLKTIAESDKRISTLTEALKDLSFSKCEKEHELQKLKKEIVELKANQKQTSEKLKMAMSKLGSASVKNASKKIKRRDKKIEKQQEELKSLEKSEEEAWQTVLKQSEALKDLNKNLELAVKAKAKSKTVDHIIKERLTELQNLVQKKILCFTQS